jgi:hypothetical protein
MASNEVCEYYKNLLRDRNSYLLLESQYTGDRLNFYQRRMPKSGTMRVEMWIGDELADTIEYEQLNG